MYGALIFGVPHTYFELTPCCVCRRSTCAVQELKGAAEQAQMPLAEHRQLLQQAQEAAAAAAREQEAGHIAEVRRTVFTT